MKSKNLSNFNVILMFGYLFFYSYSTYSAWSSKTLFAFLLFIIIFFHLRLGFLKGMGPFKMPRSTLGIHVYYNKKLKIKKKKRKKKRKRILTNSKKSFWSVGIPQNCSWSWRKILKLRDISKRFLKFEFGNGDNIHMWLDLWHPAGVLIE